MWLSLNHEIWDRIWSDAAGAFLKTNFTLFYGCIDVFYWMTFRHFKCVLWSLSVSIQYRNYMHWKTSCIFDQETQCRDAGACICWSSVCVKLQWVILNRRSVTHISLSIHWKHWHQSSSVQPSEGFVLLCAAHMWASAGLCNHTARFISHDCITIIFDMFPGRLHS